MRHGAFFGSKAIVCPESIDLRGHCMRKVNERIPI